MKTLLSIMKYGIRQSWESASYKYTIFVQPVLFSVLFFLISRSSGRDLPIISIVLKSGTISLWSSVCFSSMCDLQRERETRTIGSLLGTPISLFKVIIGKVVPNTIVGLVSFFISALSLAILSGDIDLDCTFTKLIACVPVLLLAYIVTALVIIPIFFIFDNTRLLINCIEYPIFIITGMAFPTSYLPIFLQRIGQLLPLTWGIKIVNIIFINGHQYVLQKDLIAYFIITILYIIVAVLLFEEVERQIRIKARIKI